MPAQMPAQQGSPRTWHAENLPGCKHRQLQAHLQQHSHLQEVYLERTTASKSSFSAPQNVWFWNRKHYQRSHGSFQTELCTARAQAVPHNSKSHQNLEFTLITELAYSLQTPQSPGAISFKWAQAHLTHPAQGPICFCASQQLHPLSQLSLFPRFHHFFLSCFPPSVSAKCHRRAQFN